jgi:hypothetical protein
MRITKYDMKEWLQRVYKLKGISLFKMEDLPHDLNIRGMPRLAWNDCLLTKVGKDGTGSSTKWIWQINQQRMDRWL